jgi:hypothetical protein
MFTVFTTAKPFRGHDGVIQRNALQSWKCLHQGIEVILFGDEEGAAEVCEEYGLRHEPHVERHESGLPYLDYIFARAQMIARYPYLCFSNCDIILLPDFLRAYEKALNWRPALLAVGRRWDTDITEPVNFGRKGWECNLRELALNQGKQQNHFWIDFFLFPRGLYENMPSLIVGRAYWDHWMIWRALSARSSVIDFSDAVVAVHQNHGYNPQSGRTKGFSEDSLSLRNLEVSGGEAHQRSIRAATHRLLRDGKIRRNFRRYRPPLPRPVRQARRFLIDMVWLPTWHSTLNAIRHVRDTLGFGPSGRGLNQ